MKTSPTMKKTFVLIAAGALFATAVYALPDYDPFADATGSGGTSYTVGANLIGQKNALGQTWYQAGPTATGTMTISKIVAGNLSYGGLAASQGNSVNFGGLGESARLNLNSDGSSITSGTLYYSFILQISSVSAANTGASGMLWTGFNNTAGSQTTTPSVIATQVETKTVGSGFQVGLSKASTVAANIAWDPTTRNVGDTMFIVGSYTFNPGTGIDVAQLWLNPSSSTLGLASAPTPTLTSSAGGNISGNAIATFVLENRSALEPFGTMDEVRVGTSWADVTPVPEPVPEPSTVVLAGFGLLALVSCYRARRH